MIDYAKNIRRALIDGDKSPTLSPDTKLYMAKRALGEKAVFAGGTPDWTKPTVLPAWIAGRPGAIERTAGC